MLDRISAEAWSTGDALALAALLVTLVSVGVTVGGLLVSWLSGRAALRVERAKLAMHLWERQASFAAEFFKQLREVMEQIVARGFLRDEDRSRRMYELRTLLLEATPFLPKQSSADLRAFVGRIEMMFVRMDAADAMRGDEGSEAVRRRMIDDAATFLGELVGGNVLAAEEDRIRDLLHTEELSAARKRALGFGATGRVKRALKAAKTWAWRRES